MRNYSRRRHRRDGQWFSPPLTCGACGKEIPYTPYANRDQPLCDPCRCATNAIGWPPVHPLFRPLLAPKGASTGQST